MQSLNTNIDNLNTKLSKLDSSPIETLIEFDNHGILLAPDEKIEEFKERTTRLLKNINDFNSELDSKKKINLFESIYLNREQKIPSEIMEEAGKLNNNYYAFEINWIPGFFISEHLGFLWGGCAITFPNNHISIFLIRANFAKKTKWLFYKRDELLAHELCHIARTPINDLSFEEHFAYRLSPSRLRRYMGNCFQKSYDAILFIIPFFLLLSAQTIKTIFQLYNFSITPFWILITLYPTFLFIRNQISRNKFFKAKKNLISINAKAPLPILFRSTKEEIYTMASFNSADKLKKWINIQRTKDLRWKVINKRFI